MEEENEKEEESQKSIDSRVSGLATKRKIQSRLNVFQTFTFVYFLIISGSPIFSLCLCAWLSGFPLFFFHIS